MVRVSILCYFPCLCLGELLDCQLLTRPKQHARTRTECTYTIWAMHFVRARLRHDVLRLCMLLEGLRTPTPDDAIDRHVHPTHIGPVCQAQGGCCPSSPILVSWWLLRPNQSRRNEVSRVRPVTTSQTPLHSHSS
ncbi:hypothetical protein V8C35DRAFT_270245 [Trichoderma chlorosporum]